VPKNPRDLIAMVDEATVLVTVLKKSSEKVRTVNGKSNDTHTVLPLACRDCERETKHYISVPKGQETPGGPYDFSHFCVDCNAFTSLILAKESSTRPAPSSQADRVSKSSVLRPRTLSPWPRRHFQPVEWC